MSLTGKVWEMLGLTKPKPKADYIGPDLSKALERQERASEAAREALEEVKMTQTLQSITGKMQ